MGVTASTFDYEALTPICNLCGVALCWDISVYGYEDEQEFWDGWCCKFCDPEYRKKKCKKSKF